MATITRDDILKIAEELEGTSNRLDTILDERFGIQTEDVPVGLLALLDENVMQCSTCGWWREAGEFSDDMECHECQDHPLDGSEDDDD